MKLYTKRKPLAMLLAVTLVLSVFIIALPQKAKAASPDEHLYINGNDEGALSGNLSDTYWEWDATSKTLTLRSGFNSSIRIACAYTETVYIEIDGNVSINATGTHTDTVYGFLTESYAIFCDGSLVIKNKTGSNDILSITSSGDGIATTIDQGSITIEGTLGNISTPTGYGIAAGDGVTISGTVGNITARIHGISVYNPGNITISGTVGNIICSQGEGYNAAIYAREGDILISGTVGTIHQDFGIMARNGHVIISGKIAEIGAIAQIEASNSYAVLDYTTTPPLLEPDSWLVPPSYSALYDLDYYTVDFEYINYTPTADDVKYAWVTDGAQLPVPSYGIKTWYTEPELVNLWDFDDPVTVNMTLYYGVWTQTIVDEETGITITIEGLPWGVMIIPVNDEEAEVGQDDFDLYAGKVAAYDESKMVVALYDIILVRHDEDGNIMRDGNGNPVIYVPEEGVVLTLTIQGDVLKGLTGVLLLHEKKSGELERIAATYDSALGKVVFRASEFSLYGIAADDPGYIPPVDAVKASEIRADDVPKTGARTNTALLCVICAASLAGTAVAVVRLRRR